MRRYLNNLVRGNSLRIGHPWSRPGTVRVSRGTSPKGTFKPQLEALERREVLSVATSGIVAAPPPSVLANAGSVLANPAIAPQPLPPGWVLDGEFNGNTAVEVVSTPAPNTRPAKTTVQTLNVKDKLFGLYNQDLPTITTTMGDFLSDPANTEGHTFSNIQLSVPGASPSDFLQLYVNTKEDLFGFIYSSEPCAVTCNIDSASLQVSFNLNLAMSFTTSGAPGNGPVALQYATLYVTNAVAHLSGFGTNLRQQQEIQDAFNLAYFDVTTTIENNGLAAELAYLNSQLVSYAPQAVVTPVFDASHAQFDLIVSSGVPSGFGTAPSAPALAQLDSPIPTTLVSSASQSSVSLQTDLAAIDIVMAQGAIAKKQVNADAAGSLF